MKEILTRHSRKIIGAVVGMLLGFLYYSFIGCATGSCPITANPFSSIIYGGVIGFLIGIVIS